MSSLRCAVDGLLLAAAVVAVFAVVVVVADREACATCALWARVVAEVLFTHIYICVNSNI